MWYVKCLKKERKPPSGGRTLMEPSGKQNDTAPLLGSLSSCYKQK